uniref:Moesin/ezrin/radixin homolog 1 n=1 Tax=Meloidogyne hapla TaxID=6305 RepID=A0A1I8BNS0_MELHA
MLDWLTGHGKPLRVKVTTMDADLNAISMDRDALGQDLFDTVCKIIGLREVWYFGLCFTNRKGYTCWLQLDKKVRDHSMPKQSDGSLHFIFLVKFFPESVKTELIQDLTRHLFFLQIRQSILSMDLYCPSEAAILLASYAVQAMYGDYQNDENIELDLTKLIPPSVIQQYDMSADMWHEKIGNWWANNSGLSREDAEEEFLCIAEELDMYGTSFYKILNQRGTELLLGVSAQGLGIYEPDNKLSPRPFFPWTEIKCISFKNKMFTICTADKSKIRFRAEDMSINQSLLDLCVGTHNLYLRRRQPDLLERQRRLAEQTRLQREREQRVQAESERDKLRTELGHLAEQLNTMQIVMKNTEESHQLIAERARISEQEVFEMTRRANDAEAEMQRIRRSQLRAEERKLALERKYKDAELLANRLIQQQQFNNNNNSNGVIPMTQPPPYHEQLRRSNPCSNSIKHIATNSSSLEEETTVETDEGVDEGNIEHLQQQQFPLQNNGLINGINGSNSLLPPPPPLPSNPPPSSTNNKLFTKASLAQQQRKQQKQNNEDFNGIINNNGGGSVFAALAATEQQRQTISNELQHIIASTHAELEQSRGDWQAKDHSLREKLADFRLELEALKREGAETEQDRLFAQKVAATGCFDKHSTLRKSGFGSSKSKAKMFDEMTNSKLTSNGTTTAKFQP